MFITPHFLSSPSGARLLVRTHTSEVRARGIVLVHHGLAEHSGRYARLASDLANLGFHVYVHDHRGHGGTEAPDAGTRQFARADGAALVLEDCRAVEARARASHPGLPVVLFGHSMGGIIALNFAQGRGQAFAGLCVWNANLDVGLEQHLGRVALRIERALKGSDVGSALFGHATFESWSRSVAHRRTEADWLSHSPEAVDAYLGDPLCGWRPTVSMADDIVTLVLNGGGKAGLASLPKDLPLHLLGGGKDPATERGEAVTRLAERARRVGVRDVTTIIVDGARHETLNEVESFRRPAMESLALWLERVAPPAETRILQTHLEPQR